MDIVALILADSRFPGGGHVHSGGLEEAVARGLVTGERDLPAFLIGRLRTAGELAAIFAAVAATWAARLAPARAATWAEARVAPGAATWAEARAATELSTTRPTIHRNLAPPRAPLVADRLEQGRPPKGRAGAVLGAGVAEQGWAGPGAGAGGQGWIGLRAGAGRGGVQEAGVGLGAEVSGGVRVVPWAGLDGELDARTPSVAQRVASRAQGRGTMRAGLRVWPSSVLAELVAAVARPHHAVALGAVTGVAGGSAGDAAAVAGYLSVSGPASAAVRLLGLDPFAVTAMIADLADELRAQTLRATRFVGTAPADLPAPGAPGLDLLAESHARHHTEEVRLFAS